MEQDEIKTVDEFWFENTGNKINQEEYSAVIEVIKYHVERALKEASEKAIMRDDNEDCHYEDEAGNFPEFYIIDRNSILNAYLLSNII